MLKEYTTRNISKSDFEEIIETTIKYYVRVETDYTFKFKFINFKNQSMNILALSDIQKVSFDDDYKKAYINFNDEYIIINLEKYDSFAIELSGSYNHMETTLSMDLKR